MGRVLLIFGLATLLFAIGGQDSSVAQSAAGGGRTHGSGNAANGQTVFQHACVMCHAVQPGVTIVGPSLASVMRGPHAISAHAAQQIILNGKGKMPSERGKLSDPEIADVLVYLKTL